MRIVATSLAVVGALGLAGCAVAPPSGPSFAAMPGDGKTYAEFQNDSLRCEQTAQAATPVAPAQAANQSAVGSAVLGTALGAGAGALIGSAAGAVGGGAAIGAGVGLLAGSAIGAGNAQASGAALQQRYDITYAQCMAAAGNKVPDPGSPAYSGYSGGGYGYPAYGYPAYGYGYPAPYYYGPTVVVGGGWYGWHGGWHGGYWHHWH